MAPPHSAQTKPITFIATLGGQPQVVTLALDALLAQGHTVAEVHVLCLNSNDPRLIHARARLAAEFHPDGPYTTYGLCYQEHILSTLQDIYDESDADAVWRTIYQLVAGLKGNGRPLHICISGGRRILGLMTLSAAMLQFGHQDTLWHMYTPSEVQAQARDGALMHLPPDSGFRLIRIPMMPWGSYFPIFQELARPSTGEDVLARPRRTLDSVEHARVQAVHTRLTPRQQDVLRELAAGQTPKQVAARLGINLSTVDSHKTAILAECRNAWGLPEGVRLDYRFIWEKFGEPSDAL